MGVASRYIFIFLLFLSLPTGFTTSLEYQTLVVTPLPKPKTLSWTDDSQIAALEDESEDTLSINLHHRDSLSFNATTEALFSLRLDRDAARAESLATTVESAVAGKSLHRRPGRDFSSSIISGLAQGSGEYFTRIGVGTPPRYSYMVLDTGSDVVWIQCSPCRCYNQSDPIFDPRKSSTFAGVACGSQLCRRLDSRGCSKRRTCLYQVSYGDGSYTLGDFSTETLTFRRIRVKNVALGCGRDNQGLFVGAAGLLGLGRGRLSFPVQTGRRFGRKFSYCLVDRSESSRPSSIMFGDSAVARTARFTPLITNPRLDTFYYVGLTGISVGGKRVPGINPSRFRIDNVGNGGVIIDSGTSVTRLTRPAYVGLRKAFLAGMSDFKRAPGFSLFDTCFDLSGKTEVKVPTVVLHFAGADMALPASNYLIPVDNDGSFCFAFAGTMSGLSIIGNIQQQGFRIVYDLAGSRVGFAPRGCA